MKKRRKKRTPSPAAWAAKGLGGIATAALLASGMEYGPISPIRVIAIIGCLVYAWHCAIRSNEKATAARSAQTKTLTAVPATNTRRNTTTAAGKAA